MRARHNVQHRKGSLHNRRDGNERIHHRNQQVEYFVASHSVCQIRRKVSQTDKNYL